MTTGRTRSVDCGRNSLLYACYCCGCVYGHTGGRNRSAIESFFETNGEYLRSICNQLSPLPPIKGFYRSIVWLITVSKTEEHQVHELGSGRPRGGVWDSGGSRGGAEVLAIDR